MNDFARREDIVKKTGNVIELMKDIELRIDDIILEYITPKNLSFTRDIVLNSSILPIGAKIKILKKICYDLDEKYDFKELHRLICIRNVFAHGKSFYEDENIILKFAELTDSKIKENQLDNSFSEFNQLFNNQMQLLIGIHTKVKHKLQNG